MTITRLGVLCCSLILSFPAVAGTIYTCIEEKSASIGWEEGGMLKKQGMKANAKDSKNPVSLSFIVAEKKGVLKGNLDQVDLKKIAPNVFLEVTMAGNIFMWTIVPGNKEIPTYLFQQKAYVLGGPYSITVAYKCH